MKDDESFPRQQRGEDPYRKCAEPGCPKTFRDRHQWDQRKAAKEGWFLQRDETAWCPDHIPAWVAEWRAKQAYKHHNQQ